MSKRQDGKEPDFELRDPWITNIKVGRGERKEYRERKAPGLLRVSERRKT